MRGRDTEILRRLLAPMMLALSLAACSSGDDGDGKADPQTITPFTFTPVGNAAPGALVYSEETTLAGFTDAMNISVEGGAYCINLVTDENGDNCTDAAGTVNAGDKLSLRATAPEGSGEQVQVAVTVTDGADLSYSTSFTVVTRVDSSLPSQAIVIPALKGLDPGGQGFTDAVIVDGFTGVLSVSADEGVRISIDGGAFVEGPADIVAGQAVAFEVTAPAEAGAPATRTVRFSNGENEITSEIDVEARDASTGGPDDFAFEPVTDAELDTGAEAEVTLGGEFTGLPITISGGEYSINEGPFTTNPGTVDSGDFLLIRLHTASQFATESRVRVTIGEGETAMTRYFRVTTKAEPEGVNRPDPFVFGKHVNAEPGSNAESRTLAVSGFDGELPVSVEAASEAAAQVLVNDAVVQDGALVSAGDTIQVRATAAATFATAQAVLVHLGEGDDRQTGRFEIVTREKDTEPLPFTFGSAFEANHGEEVLSPVVTLTGFDGDLPVELSAAPAANAQMSVDGGEFTAGPGAIGAGQTLQIKATAPGEAQDPQRNVTVNVGTGETAVAATFSIITADVVPNEFSFGTATLEAPPGEIVRTTPVVVSGFDGALTVTVEGDPSARIAIDGAFNNDGVITAGQTLTLELAAPSAANAEATATVHVGDGTARVSAGLTIRTFDVQADAFSFSPPSVGSADPLSDHLFQSTPLGGFVGAIKARVQDGAAVFRVVHEGGVITEFDTNPKDVIAGDIIEVLVTADAAIGNTVPVVVSVGDAPNTVSTGVSVTTGDNVPPSFTIDFPTPKSVTQAETVTLTGRFTENHLPEQAIIRGFNGDSEPLEGIVRADGHWQMVVDLDVGLNTFTLEMEDTVGFRSGQQSVEVVRDAEIFPERPASIAFDETSNTIYALEGANRFVSLDLDTREFRVISEANVGSGEPLDAVGDRIVLDEANARLLAMDIDECSVGNCKIVGIDITSGVRNVLTEGISDLRSIALGNNGRILFLGSFSDDPGVMAIAEFDPVAGEVDLVSRLGSQTSPVGGGTIGLDHAQAIAFDANRGSNGAGVIYVIAHDRGTQNSERRILQVQYLNGDRDLLTSSQMTGMGQVMVIPIDLTVDDNTGNLYVADGGTFNPGFGVPSTRPVYRVITAGANAGLRELIVSNETSSIDLGNPISIITVVKDGQLRLWIADNDRTDGIVQTQVIDTRQAIVPALEVGSGADFDGPFALELDAENDRLLVLSETSVQSVGISDGLRSEKIYAVPSGANLRFGGLHLTEDQLWLTTNGDFRGLATIQQSSLDAPGAALTQRYINVGGELGESGALLVEGALDDAVVYFTTDDANGDANGFDFIKKVTFANGTSTGITHVFGDNFDVGPQTTLFHRGPGQLLFPGLGNIYLVDDSNGDILHEAPLVDVGDDSVQSYSGFAFDENRQRLYVKAMLFSDESLYDDFIRFDIAGGLEDAPVMALGLDDLRLPGGKVSVGDIFGLRMDSERNRIYGLLDEGRNVVAINVAEILFNDQGLPARKGDTLSEDGPAPSGEAVLISRSENLENPPPAD